MSLAPKSGWFLAMVRAALVLRVLVVCDLLLLMKNPQEKDIIFGLIVVVSGIIGQTL